MYVSNIQTQEVIRSLYTSLGRTTNVSQYKLANLYTLSGRQNKQMLTLIGVKFIQKSERGVNTDMINIVMMLSNCS